MKKLFFVFFIAILMLPVANLTAQEGFTLLSFDIGQAPSFLVDGSNTLSSHAVFGLNVRVAGPMIIGFTNYDGFARFVKGKFDINGQLRAVIGYGTGNIAGTPPPSPNYSGLGFEIIPFRRAISGLYTEFKLSPFYAFVNDGVAKGRLLLPLALSVGF
ncbi:MAG: hypothetical protein LBC80_03160 [Treponema sp.]|jgi:hypothetical protein|nr:hypothetical protein [Treponema sp.]